MNIDEILLELAKTFTDNGAKMDTVFYPIDVADSKKLTEAKQAILEWVEKEIDSATIERRVNPLKPDEYIELVNKAELLNSLRGKADEH